MSRRSERLAAQLACRSRPQLFIKVRLLMSLKRDRGQITHLTNGMAARVSSSLHYNAGEVSSNPCDRIAEEKGFSWMSVEQVDTLVVGAGQAGIAMSEHLSTCGLAHLVVERHRIAERWRTERWDSLVANGPAWHDRFPGMEFPGIHPDAFPSKEQVADYFVAYAKKITAPIRCGVEVREAKRLVGRPGFSVDLSDGMIEAQNIVVATGAFQVPLIPTFGCENIGVFQIHSSAYRNPHQLPAGAVLVIGAGSSGVQIAEELLRAGKPVYLSVGPHDRPPRAYRGRDYCWWLGVLGKWDADTPRPQTEHVTIAVSGAYGGYTIDFRRLAAQGMTLVGRAVSYQKGAVTFACDLADNLSRGDANYMSLLDEADAYVVDNGLELPEDPAARSIAPDPACVTSPILELNLADKGITSIILATGFTTDYSWLKVNAFDENGRPNHRRGVSSEPGIYFLGLPWLSRRGSSFIWGVWHDAKYLADRIATRHKYREYHASTKARSKT